MISHRLWIGTLCVLLGIAGPALCADPPPPAAPAAPQPPRPPADKQVNPAPDLTREVQAMATTIDRHINATWEAKKIKPAPLADDAEFMRRAYLDLAGRIPSVAEARTFINDKDPYKRTKLVDRLLDSPAYVNHLTNVWRVLMLPETETSFEVKFLAPGFEAWIRKQISENAPYDRMVRDLITTSIPRDTRRGIGVNFGEYDPSPIIYFMVKEAKPETLAAATSQLFLGVKIECAQCHDHPFAKWSREQFWSYASFFAGVQRQGRGGDDNLYNPIREITDRRELAIPGKDEVVQARFLDGTEPQWKYQKGARDTLAEWMTSSSNPYFARAAANRVWAHFFGVGIVDPVDDFRDDNPASHPQLLDELARELIAHKFDLKFLMRAITASRAYQLTSAFTDPSQQERRLFSRMPVKGMTGEQLFESLATATGYRDPIPVNRRQQVGAALNTPRAQFVTKFASTDKKTETQTSILQALSMMNGQFISDATTVDKSDLLAGVVDAPFMSTAGRIETLYLGTLSRKPRADELDLLVKYVEDGGTRKDRKAALGDVFWALLNSSEFLLNH